MKTMIIDNISAPTSDSSSLEMVQRLYELGLRPGIEVKIVCCISFGTVTVIEYGHTRLALNQQEMACLHGH